LTWSATFKDKCFQEDFAPRLGSLRMKVKVGGVPWYTAELPVVDFTAKLTRQN
jgi:hypothetical protein